ncbi:MAG: glycosyltransferase [candidate division Zixibacteria bacterium]|nr:glycosyltransferase [candidate division Zixibacteria bacterium]
MAKKKIFILTHNYPQNENDMAGIFLKNLINDLSDDFDFHVCPIRFGGTMHKLYKNPLKWSKLWNYFRQSSKTAQKEFKKGDYDLIWAHWWLPPGMIASRLSRKTGCPLMVTCHGTDAFMLRDIPLLRPAANRVFKTAKIVNVVSKYMASITTQDSVVLNMPYNQEIFNYQGEEKDDKYLICPSAFIKRKNIDLLIKAASEIPEIKVKVFGSGLLKDHLELMAKDVENVEIHAPLDQKSLAKEYKKAGAVILPSVGEGFGLTLPEGAACGCFALATHDGGMVEIVEQTGGINFPHDPSGNEIKKAIRKYLDSLPVDRDKIAESAKIYSREKIIPSYKEILHDLT